MCQTRSLGPRELAHDASIMPFAVVGLWLPPLLLLCREVVVVFILAKPLAMKYGERRVLMGGLLVVVIGMLVSVRSRINGLFPLLSLGGVASCLCAVAPCACAGAGASSSRQVCLWHCLPFFLFPSLRFFLPPPFPCVHK